VANKVSKTGNSGNSSPRKPLKGRTILVTQAPHQAKRFSNLLKEKGARILKCPTIDVIPFNSPNAEKTLRGLDKYDWLVFMSQNAVSYFFDQLKRFKISRVKLKGIRIAALGKTTREALKENKLRVHLVPQVYQSEHLASAFKRKIEDKKFLILNAYNGRNVLADALREKGAEVDVLPLYKTILPIENAQMLSRYIREERIDAITFTSPSTVENFVKMLNPDRYLFRYLETLTIATLGDVTAKAVEDQGLRVRVKPSDFTIPAFVNTLSREL